MLYVNFTLIKQIEEMVSAFFMVGAVARVRSPEWLLVVIMFPSPSLSLLWGKVISLTNVLDETEAVKMNFIKS